ncbi:MAG TPA: carboxy terminal-processing peptidase [Lacipirellulaceae bacterium]|nr:carboxy terminal-processing peptidase [Lacipirellulaceae bacterium]
MTQTTQLRFRRLISGVAIAAILLTTAGIVSARPTQPSKADRQITLAVAMLMERQHLTRQGLDDTISERTLKTFIKDLDPLKLFFYQSDIDGFNKNKDSLDDMIKHGDVSFAYDVFSLFLSRVDERITMAEAELNKPENFDLDEEMVRDPDTTKYAKTPEEATERWRKRVKFDLLKETADKVPMDEAIKKLTKRYDSIRKSWQQTDNDELLERYLTAMTSAFDPHSSYMSPSTLDNFNIQMKLELEGIGASLRGVDGYTVVQNVIPGGAADKNGGMKPEDKIVGVGEGTSGPIEDIVDMKLNDVVKKIRGKRGTVVRLEVEPKDGSGRKTLTITRDKIELKDSEARSEIIPWGKKADGTQYQVGVIQLPSFYMDMDGARLGLADYKSTTRDVRRLLEEFKTKGVDACIVDLRWNGGGSLTEAVNMTGLFIDGGPVVQVKGPDGRTMPYKPPTNDATYQNFVWQGPLVVMIDKFSASASEIFAGAIQDYDRGIVVGDKTTHGKGTVQQLFDLGNALFRVKDVPNMGALKLTIQQFYRPGGDSTQNRGVVSNVELPSLTTHLDVGESDLDYALKFSKVDPMPHDDFHMFNAQIIDGLRQRSENRVKDSDYFAKEERQIKRYEEQKDKKTVTLNKEKFMKEREELDSDKEQEKMFDDMNDPKRPVYEMDGYGKEALNITVDYLDLLGGNKVAVARPDTAAQQSAVIPQ